MFLFLRVCVETPGPPIQHGVDQKEKRGHAFGPQHTAAPVAGVRVMKIV